MTNQIPSINAGSMADIAFLLLVFFLVTTTMENDMGIQRNLSTLEENTSVVEYDERNVFEIQINAFNQILANNQSLEANELSQHIKHFIQNPNQNPKLSESYLFDFPAIGSVPISKQVILIKSDNSTSYQTYIQVQDEIARAYHQLRNEFSQKYWGLEYQYILKYNMRDELAILNQVYPFNISEDKSEDVLAQNH